MKHDNCVSLGRGENISMVAGLSEMYSDLCRDRLITNDINYLTQLSVLFTSSLRDISR